MAWVQTRSGALTLCKGVAKSAPPRFGNVSPQLARSYFLTPVVGKRCFCWKRGERLLEEKKKSKLLLRCQIAPTPTPLETRTLFLVVQTLVLSGYFRLSPRKIIQDGRRPLPWTARRSAVLIPLCPGWAGPLSLEREGPGGHRSGAVESGAV